MKTSVKNNQPANQARASRIRALSLVELLGVMAILAIITAAVLPPVVRRVDSGAWLKESNDMAAISNAMVLQVVRNYAISNQTGWAVSVANWAMKPTSQISTNNRRLARLFFYDQGGWMTNAPFVQTSTGTASVVPSNARVAIVSSIGRALPYTNGPLSTADFNSIWNATQGTKPGYISALGWNGNPYDLVIQRVTLDPLFHRLVLANRDPTTNAMFTVNSTNIVDRIVVTNNATAWSSYYLDGTVVALWGGATLTNRFVLTRDTSYTFEGGMWGNGPTGSGKDGTATAQSFVNIARTFITMPNTGHQGADTQGALSAFYSFLYAYTIWANKCPHFQYVGNANQAVDYQILDTLGQNSSAGIIYNTTSAAGGGLLQ